MADQTVEIWKPVPEYPELNVEASNWGHLKINGQLQRLQINNQGYPLYYIPTPYKKMVLAHILICTIFNGPKPFPSARCRIKDGVVTHLTRDNLYWALGNNRSANSTIQKAQPTPNKTVHELPTEPKKTAKELKAERKGKHYWEDLPPPLR